MKTVQVATRVGKAQSKKFQRIAQELQPDVVIVHDSKTLVKDVDYTLSSYSKNIEDQGASVTITGKGNYSGVLTASFKISLPKFVDSRDSKGYNIAKIGNQIWFAENLNYPTLLRQAAVAGLLPVAVVLPFYYLKLQPQIRP